MTELVIEPSWTNYIIERSLPRLSLECYLSEGHSCRRKLLAPGGSVWVRARQRQMSPTLFLWWKAPEDSWRGGGGGGQKLGTPEETEMWRQRQQVLTGLWVRGPFSVTGLGFVLEQSFKTNDKPAKDSASLLLLPKHAFSWLNTPLSFFF